jgi:hypothetical protein
MTPFDDILVEQRLARLHVVPLADLRDHEDSPACWCHPTEDEQASGIYVHHSMDGREAFERGERLPS